MSTIPSCALPRAARPSTAVYGPRRPEKAVVYEVVQQQQWVLCLPERLRYFLHRDPALIGPVLRIVLDAVEDRLKASSPGAPAPARFGAVTFVHRFGSALNANLHFDEIRPVEAAPLLKVGLAHVQFETIHPFLDGNGRVGRLLIALVIVSDGALHEPLLYLSLYFKQHRQEYYAHLNRARERGGWEEWLRFFAEGVRDTAEGAVSTARRLSNLFARDLERVHAAGRGAGSAARLLAAFRVKWTPTSST